MRISEDTYMTNGYRHTRLADYGVYSVILLLITYFLGSTNWGDQESCSVSAPIWTPEDVLLIYFLLLCAQFGTVVFERSVIIDPFPFVSHLSLMVILLVLLSPPKYEPILPIGAMTSRVYRRSGGWE